MTVAIGVDLGGHQDAGRGGGLRAPGALPLHRAAATAWRQDELLEELERELRAALEARPDVAAAGLGIPCTIDRERGVAIIAVNLELADVPIRDLMTERLGLPVFDRQRRQRRRCSPSTASAPPAERGTP